MNILNQALSAGLLAMCLRFTGVTTATAVCLFPGTTVAVQSEPEPTGAQLIASETASFNSSDFTGTLSSQVWSNDTANPSGGLTFAYQHSIESDWCHSMRLLTACDFSDLQVDVSDTCRSVAQRSAMRSGYGDAITCITLDTRWRETLVPDTSSARLTLQTDCSALETNRHVKLDCQTLSVESIAPVAIPEPAGYAVTGVGLLAILQLYRRKQ